MKSYPTQKFVWQGIAVELRPNAHLPGRFTDLYIAGKLEGIYPVKEATKVAKALGIVTYSTEAKKP